MARDVFSIVRNASVMLWEEGKKNRGAYAFTLLRWHLNKQELFSSQFCCTVCAAVIWSCHKQILQHRSCQMSAPVKRDDGLRKSRPGKLLVREEQPERACLFMSAHRSSNSCGRSERTRWAAALTRVNIRTCALWNHLFLVVGNTEDFWAQSITGSLIYNLI